MYCKKCGAQITNDSVYCSKCGQKQDAQIEQIQPIQKEKEKFQYPPEFQGEPYKIKTKKEEKGRLWWLCLIIVVSSIITLVIIPAIWGIANNKNNKLENKKEIIKIIEKTEYTRKTEVFDFDIDAIWNLNNNQVILLIDPQSDIRNLTIQINFYDVSGEIILQKEQNIKYLKKDNQFISVVNFNEINNKKGTIKNIEYILLSGTTIDTAQYIEKEE